MKICIFGVGAVAGLAGARMIRGGVDSVSLVARGPHLDAIRSKGLTVRDRDGEWTVQAPATDDTASLGVQDVVVIGLKAHTVRAALDQIRPLIGPDTVVVPTLNGIPWWYFHALEGDWDKQHLVTVDPNGAIWQAIGPEKTLGCVVYIASNIPEPGVIEHNNGCTYIVGELDGSQSERGKTVVEMFSAGGLKSHLADDIRAEVWTKLWGNLSGNPMSVLCEADCLALVEDAEVRGIMSAMMEEAQRVAHAIGCDVTLDLEGRLAAFRSLGPVKTSMLQDYDSGKSIELDALLGVIGELGRMAGVETPTCDMIYATTRLKAAGKGRYTPPV